MTDLVLRARRVVTPDGERPAAVRVSSGRIVSVDGFDAPAGPDPAGVRACRGGHPRRLRAAAGPGRHPRAHQRARAGPSGRASTTATAGRGRRRGHHAGRHAAELRAADRRPSRRWPRSGAAADGPVPRRRRLLGRRGARQRSARPARPLHDGRACSASSASCSTPGVPEFPPLRPGRAAAALRRIAAFDGLLLVHAEDPGGDRARRPAAPAAATRAFLASRPRGGRDTRPSAWLLDAAARDRLPGRTWCTCPAPTALPLLAPPAADGVAGHRRDLPALPDPRPPSRCRTGRPQFKCCPPIRGRRPTGSGCGQGSGRRHRSTSSCPTTRRARRSSSGWTPATSARPGAASRRCSWRCR